MADASVSTATSATEALHAQWQNPGDIFSLLLLVGGDIVQKAIARLAGVRFSIYPGGPRVHINPVAFSFGWVAYAFITLAATLGYQRLMPDAEIDIKVINCDSGYDRDNKSWVLSRLFRDREEGRIQALTAKGVAAKSVPDTTTTGELSLGIDILVAGNSDGPRPGSVWWLCWLVILAQHGLAICAWVVYGQWPIFLITAAGTALSIITASLPQWIDEKWASRRLEPGAEKVTALTRGNGHRYVMIIISHGGSWDIEAMASAWPANSVSSKWILGLFASLWVLLLITATGIKDNTWLLIGIGGLGTLQNVIVAAIPCSPEELDLKVDPWQEKSSIAGYRYIKDVKKKLMKEVWPLYTAHDPTKPNVQSSAQTEYDKKLDDDKVRDVMGALIELEKYWHKAGAALLPIFFPGNLDYAPGFGILREKYFWEYAELRAK